MQERIFAALSIERMMADVRHLAEAVPARLSGSAAERVAAEYLQRQFAIAGIEMTLHEFDAWVSFPGEARIEVEAPQRRTIAVRAAGQSPSTPPEGIVADLRYVGGGAEADYTGMDAAGCITLSELALAPARPQKARFAEAHGAVGHIVANWGPPGCEAVPMGTCKSVWGNPSGANAGRQPGIPVLGISRADAEWLQQKMHIGPVRLRMFSTVETGWHRVILPVARIPGAVEPEKFVLVAGHYDSWAGGATDNATGNAIMTELARVIASYRADLRRSVVFAFWPGHETGIMAGSSWFVDRNWDDISRNCVFTATIDQAGLKQASDPKVYCTPEVAGFHGTPGQLALGRDDLPALPLQRAGDQSFFGMGLPSVYAVHEPDAALKAEWGGAVFGWWYHSDLDGVDKVDPAGLLADARLNAAFVWQMATLPVLPFDHRESVARLLGRMRELARHEVGIDLSRPIALLESLAGAAEALRARQLDLATAQNAADCAACNQAQQALAASLGAVGATIAGRWGQDDYGLPALGHALPGLAMIPEMAAAGRDSDLFRLGWTDAIRQRNRISDTLTEALERLNRWLEL